MKRNPVLYEISTRPWLYELSKKYSKKISKIKEIPLEEFDEIKTYGIDYIWMMGVWKLGKIGLELDQKVDYSSVLPDFKKEDIIGSPFAITEYECNPEIGTDEDLLWLKMKLNEKNLKLILDFVPNHSAIDSIFTKSNPEYYIRENSENLLNNKYYTNDGFYYGKDPYFDPWPDVIQFNYFNEKTAEFMKNNLIKILKLCDGVRCDMAHLILNEIFYKTWKDKLEKLNYKNFPQNEFWANLKEIKQNFPDKIFLAEVYEEYLIEKLYNLGFDYCYNKELLDKLTLGPNEVNNYIHYKNEKFFNHVAHFIENHDENRAIFTYKNIDKSNCAGCIAATLGGMIFINHNQFKGFKNKLDVHLIRASDENENEICVKFYKKLMEIIKDDAFRSQNYYYVYNVNGNDSWKLISYLRKDINSYLSVVNYTDENACANVPIYDVKGNGDVKILEMFSGIEYIRNADSMRDQGLTVVLKPFQPQIFKYNYN